MKCIGCECVCGGGGHDVDVEGDSNYVARFVRIVQDKASRVAGLNNMEENDIAIILTAIATENYREQ